MLCRVVVCHVVLCHVMICYIMLSHAMLCCVMLWAICADFLYVFRKSSRLHERQLWVPSHTFRQTERFYEDSLSTFGPMVFLKNFEALLSILKQFWSHFEVTFTHVEASSKQCWSTFDAFLTKWNSFEAVLKQVWGNFEAAVKQVWSNSEAVLEQFLEKRNNSEGTLKQFSNKFEAIRSKFKICLNHFEAILEYVNEFCRILKQF